VLYLSLLQAILLADTYALSINIKRQAAQLQTLISRNLGLIQDGIKPRVTNCEVGALFTTPSIKLFVLYNMYKQLSTLTD